MPEIDDNNQHIDSDAVLPEQPVEDVPAQVEQPTGPAAHPAEEASALPVELPARTDAAHPAPEAPDAAFVEGVSGGVTWIPFAVYLGCWVVLAGLSAYFLQGATPESPAQWMPAYEPLLWGGLGLTALGPLMSIVVWLVARARRSAAHRHGLLASVMTRGALTTFFGVLVWIGTLYVLELLGSGWAL